jgi:hypothetical protein
MQISPDVFYGLPADKPAVKKEAGMLDAYATARFL